MKSIGGIVSMVLALCVALYVVYLGIHGLGVSGTHETGPAIGAGASAFLACRDFAQMEREMVNGLLAPAQVLAGVQGIRVKTRVTPQATIRAAGDEMLRAANTGNEPELAAAMDAFKAACIAIQ